MARADIFVPYAYVCIKRYVDFDTLIPIDSTLIAIPFFLLGYRAKDFLVRFSDQKYAIFIAFLCLLLGLCISKYNGRVDMNTCKLGNSILFFYAIAGVISFSLLLLFLRIKTNTLNTASGGVKILSMGAPVVVGLNLLLIPFMKLAFISVNLQWDNLLGIIAGFLLMLIFIPIILFCQKFAPAFLGNRKIL